MEQKNERGLKRAFDKYPLTKLVILFGLMAGTIAAFFNPTAAATISTLSVTSAIIIGMFLES